MTLPIRLSDLIAVAILFLSLVGGVQFYRLPAVIPAFLVFGLLAVPIAAWLVWRGQRSPFLTPAAVFLLAMVFSALVNIDIWPTTLSRIILAVVALAVMILAHAAGPEMILDSIHEAALTWPVVCFIGLKFSASGWSGNANIIAFWSVPFVVILAYKKNCWPFVLPNLIILFLTGSRGAVLALVVALAVLFRFTRRAPHITLLIILVALIGLAAWRPDGTIDRLIFWRDAIQAALDNPIFGIGPGGIHARALLIDGYPHAHNIFFSIWPELGAIGLLACLFIGYWLYTSRFTFYVSRPALAILTGILAHCLVDDLLWWTGPLMFFAMVVGGSKKLPPDGQEFGRMRS